METPKCLSTKQSESVIVVQSDLLVLAVTERAPVLLGVETGYYEKQKQPGQLVHCLLGREA